MTTAEMTFRVRKQRFKSRPDLSREAKIQQEWGTSYLQTTADKNVTFSTRATALRETSALIVTILSQIQFEYVH